jgi:hypothetical protein
VTYDRAGTANLGIVSCLLEDGRRGFARTDAEGAIAQLLSGDPVGREVRLDGSAGFSLA